jgi:predicted nucleic acid-binding protein
LVTTSDAPEERVVAPLRRELDEGESEAIALSLQLQPEYGLLDERDARRVAKSQQLPVIGVVGVLIRGKLQGDLPSLRLALEDLRARAGFHLSAEIVASAVATVGEQA